MMMYKDVHLNYQTPTTQLLQTKAYLNDSWANNNNNLNFNDFINNMNVYDSTTDILKYNNLIVQQELEPLELIKPTSFKEELIHPHEPSKNQKKKLLEKNREAAYRCRQKKKKYINELEERSRHIEETNKQLQQQIAQLREESIYLRNLLLTHGDCDCEVVQSYLRRTSERLSSFSSNSYMNSPPLIDSNRSSSASSISTQYQYSNENYL